MAGTNSSEKLKSKEILGALNEAFSETEKPEDTTLREKSKRSSKWYNRKNMGEFVIFKIPLYPPFPKGDLVS